MPAISDLEKKAHQIRNLVLDMCIKGKTGHVTSSFSCVEILVALYYGGILRHNPTDPTWKDRDRFILSKGQASVVLYPVLADRGYFPLEELDHFAGKDGKFGVHLQHDVPGAEITAGSLGIGFGIAAGISLVARKNQEDYITYALLGDGECHEGSTWETAMFAAHHELRNLVAIVDRNHLCATAFTEKAVRLEPLAEKWKAFGWRVHSINGHSIKDLLSTFEKIHSDSFPGPSVVIADTIKGKGIPFMYNNPLWHGIAPVGKDAERAKVELNRNRQ